MKYLDQSGVLLWIGSSESAREFMMQMDELNHYEVNGVPTSVLERLGSVSGDEEQRRFGDYDDFVEVEGTLAIVPVKGKLAAKENWLTRLFGIMTYETLSNTLATIVADGGISDVLLDVDSPGGMAKGIDVASDAIKATQASGIPVNTHTSGEMASAAYWVGSTASPVMASEHAEVGSIGVIAVHTEYTERFKQEGIKHTVLRKGEEKALATPFEKLTPQARAQIDESMERSYQSFIDQVTENTGLPRDYVATNLATGKVFSASEALNLQMIDKVVSYSDAINSILSEQGEASASSANTNPNQNWSKAAMSKKPETQAGKPALSAEEAATAVAAGIPGESIPQPPTAPQSESEEAAEVTIVEPPEGDAPAASAESTEQTPAAQEPAPPAQQAADVSAVTKMLADVNQQLIDAKVELAAVQNELTELKAGNVGFRQIAVEQTQRMRVALGLSGQTDDLDRMSDASLVTAHEEVRGKYLEHFNIGARSQAPAEDTTLPPETVTRLDQAVRRVTAIK